MRFGAHERQQLIAGFALARVCGPGGLGSSRRGGHGSGGYNARAGQHLGGDGSENTDPGITAGRRQQSVVVGCLQGVAPAGPGQRDASADQEAGACQLTPAARAECIVVGGADTFFGGAVHVLKLN